MRYQTLVRDRDALIAEGRALFDTAERENRALTEAEQAADDDRNTRLTAMNGEIARFERQRDNDRTAAAVATHPAITGGHDRASDDPMWGFRNHADFALSVRNACRPGAAIADERLAATLRFGAAPSSYHQETGSSTQEGYMVPPAMRDQIWDNVNDPTDPDLINMVTPEPTSSNAVELLADESTPWGSTGIQASWRVEGAQMSASKLATNARQVRLNELYAFVIATDELIADAPRLNDRLTRGAGRAIKWKASDSIMRGTGAGIPLGFLNSGALVTQAAEGGQTATTFNAQNAAKMFSRLLNGYSKAVWLVNNDVLPQLLTMTLGNNTIYMPPASGFQNAPGGFLLGRPVIPNEHCSTLGTVGDVVFFNPDGFYATQKAGEGLKADQSIHLFFDYGMTAFRWTFRMGGEPFLSAPVTPNKGSNTRSHFVTLAAR